jgi:GTP1/Obg family GTP-binding protein
MLIVENKKNICENCEKLKRTMQQIRRRFLTGTNSIKIIHASKDLLIKQVKEQRKVIKMQKMKISNIKNYLEKRIEKEEVDVLDKMANVIHDIAKSFTSKNIDISHLHPIFQELIRIQTGKSNGTRYHPM